MMKIAYTIRGRRFLRVLASIPKRLGIEQKIFSTFPIEDGEVNLDHTVVNSEDNMIRALTKWEPDIVVETKFRTIKRYKENLNDVYYVVLGHGVTGKSKPRFTTSKFTGFDLFCCATDNGKDWFCEMNPKAKAETKCLPQFDLLYVNNNGIKTILFASNKVPSDNSETRELLTKLEEICKDEYKLYFKPRNDINIDTTATVIGQNEQIYDYLASADIVIIDGEVSSLEVEATIINKPVIVIRQKCGEYDDLWTIGGKAVYHVNSVNNINQTLIDNVISNRVGLKQGKFAKRFGLTNSGNGHRALDAIIKNFNDSKGKMENKPLPMLFIKNDTLYGLPKGAEFIITSGNVNYNITFMGENKANKLLDNKDVAYGLTKYGDTWWVCVGSDIVSFKLQDGKAKNIKRRIYGFHKNTHQIDFVDDNLLVTDTTHNRVLVYNDVDLIKKPVPYLYFDKAIYPNGKIFVKGNKKTTHNYAHLNSIFCFGDTIYLVAHNYSAYTGEKSELILLDKDMSIIGRKWLNGSSCHNYYTDGHVSMYCDSGGGRFIIDDQVIIQDPNIFFRGLSISDDFIIVGGSRNIFSRNISDRSSFVFFIDRESYKLLSYIKVDKTNISDIRRVDKQDMGISNLGNK